MLWRNPAYSSTKRTGNGERKLSGGHRRGVEVLPPPGRASLREVGSRDRLSPKRGIAESKVAGRQN